MDCFTHKKRPDHQRVAAGFSRLDLLAVLAVVGILFLLTAAGVANDGASSESITCVQNQKQLIRAWQLYAEDNDGRVVNNFGGNGSRGLSWASHVTGFQNEPRNWSTDYVLSPKLVLLGSYVKDAPAFRCPSDKSKIVTPGATYPRNRSFTMNYYIGKGNDAFFPNSNHRFYRRLSDFVNPTPADHYVFIDTHPDYLVGSDFHVNAQYDRGTRWLDYPAAFHSSGASISFVDGHVVIRVWAESSTRPPVRYSTGSSGIIGDGHDYGWLAQRASAPAN